MNKELIIDSSPSEVVIALLTDNKLQELHKEKSNNNYSVGDLYLGKVKKIVANHNAAFVDVGYEKDAFLHYLDLGPQIRSLNKLVKLAHSGKTAQISMETFKNEADIEKTGKISNVLQPNQYVLVQIVKEPISNKGPRITTEIAFAGRYLVLVPFSDRISVSQKIKSFEEKNRLKRLVQSIKPQNFGVIIRTVAEDRKVVELIADLNDLVAKWNSVVSKLNAVVPPQKIHSEMDRTFTILRDLLNDSFNQVVVNDSVLAEQLKSYVESIAPAKKDIVKLYKGKVPIFDHYEVDKQIKNSFGKRVNLKSGCYLIIEHTEAMHVVDVNSGHRTSPDGLREANQENNALDVNLEAATEIARQLRLRDMGGIIVIDFIDMHDKANRRALYEKLSKEMMNDHAKHTILPPSKFGLVQITRQRVRPEMNVQILEKCPSCEGTGEIRASIILVDEIENFIRFLIQEQNERFIRLAVHPYLYAYLTKGFFSIRSKWSLKFKTRIRIIARRSYHMLEYHVFNKMDDELKI